MDTLRKKLIYRSLNRGCRENDFLLKAFAERGISKLPESKLKTLDDFLQEDDLEIFTWITTKLRAPKKYQTLINQIKRANNAAKNI